MEVIKFSSSPWLLKFRMELQKHYKKMFHPGDKMFDYMWQLYVDNYYKAKEMGLDIPEEMEYPVFFDYFLNDVESDNYTEFHKEQYKKFCTMMEETIRTIDLFLEEN